MYPDPTLEKKKNVSDPQEKTGSGSDRIKLKELYLLLFLFIHSYIVLTFDSKCCFMAMAIAFKLILYLIRIQAFSNTDPGPHL